MQASSNCQECIPVRMLALEGEHFGFDAKAFSNNAPSLTILSKAGVHKKKFSSVPI